MYPSNTDKPFSLPWTVFLSTVVSFVTYYGLAGWLQWKYYIKQKDKPKEWKCQPNKFLTPENEWHEVIVGSLNMLIGGVVSGIIATYILNGGKSALYYNMADYGLVYLLISPAMVFVIQEACGYYVHRMYHIPYLYKHIHKWHHRYNAPSTFSATAMHPIEFLSYQAVLIGPMFFIPIYAGSFIALLLYSYYYGMIDHSGIKMESMWPWQPSSMYHDNHHKY